MNFFLDQHRYTLMALLSATILIGSGISLGVGLFKDQETEVTEATIERSEIAEDAKQTRTNVPINEKININTASADELDLLPGIGSVYAQRIIDYRNKNGPFKTISEIQNVSGIGPKTFEKIKDLITVK